MTEREFSVGRGGFGVIRSLERFLETGDASKINRGLYQELTSHCGFIAHYDLHGFRRRFDGLPNLLLRGEFYDLQELPEPVSVYVYNDGFSSCEVLTAFRQIATRYTLG